MLKRALITLINIYKLTISPLIGPHMVQRAVVTSH